MSKRPLIIVTGPDRGGLAAWLFTAWALRRSGARVRRVRPSRPCSLDGVDGVVIGGGEDVGPELYGEKPIAVLAGLLSIRQRVIRLASTTATRLIAPLVYVLRWVLRSRSATDKQARASRDALETSIIQQAFQRQLPILGICRGAQLINVTLGGTLFQELDAFYTESPQVRSVLPAKRVHLTEGSRLAGITRHSSFRVNALHSQAVKALGEGFRIAAAESNGVIQAIEHKQLPVIGVQWHPEYLPQHRHQRALFSALVQASQRNTQ